MEVGEEAADNLKFVAGAEEDVGLAVMSGKRLTVGELGAMLKRTGCGGSDGNDAISRL